MTSSGPPDKTFFYWYDALDRLVKVNTRAYVNLKYETTVQTYVYDAIGNRTKLTTRKPDGTTKTEPSPYDLPSTL